MAASFDFPATLAAARAAAAAVRPDDYARSRNFLDGAVTRQSPYLTHGLLSTAEILRRVQARHTVSAHHKLVFELGWREYYRHVWAHRGTGILQSLHPGVLPDDAYSPSLPSDIREARTGIPVIDETVRTLYAHGYIHNHARMWLASYVIHLRKIHWRTGADWLYAHLLDGDLASNHLSWQWVAGTSSPKPYLFNAENVARYAPPPYHSPGTVIDTSYADLDTLARETSPIPTAPSALSATVEPTRYHESNLLENVSSPDPELIRNRSVWLVHPWSLGALPEALSTDVIVIAYLPQEFHALWPWSDRRWAFVSERLTALTPHTWFTDTASLASALTSARTVQTWADPHIDPWLPSTVQRQNPETIFPLLASRCDSFSRWWHQVNPPTASRTQPSDPASQLSLL